MDETSTTQWELIQVEDTRGKEPLTHVLAVEVRSRRLFATETKPPRLESARIELVAYVVSGGGPSTQPIVRMGGSYQGGIDPKYTLTGGSMLIDPGWRGLHIGTYLQNKVITWATVDIALAARIVPITLSANDALTADARDRRNRFYEQFGITFWPAGTPPEARTHGRSSTALTIADVAALATVTGVKVMQVQKGVARIFDRALRAEGDLSASRKGWQGHHTHMRGQLVWWRRACAVCGAAGAVVGYCLHLL